METTKVGVREFRAGLTEYISGKTPVAVTRHGQTIGYFIPAHGQYEAELASLRMASKALDDMLSQHKIDADEVVSEFKQARKQARKK